MNKASSLAFIMAFFISGQSYARLPTQKEISNDLKESRSISLSNSIVTDPSIDTSEPKGSSIAEKFGSAKESVTSGLKWMGDVMQNMQGCEASGGTWAIDLTSNPGGFCIEAKPECGPGRMASPSPRSGGSQWICISSCPSGETFVSSSNRNGGSCIRMVQENEDDEDCGGPTNPCREPESLMTIEQCRENGYRHADCRRSEELRIQHAEDVGTISEARLARAEACRESSVRVGTSCSDYSQEVQTIVSSTNTAGGDACSIANAAPASQASVNEHKTSCEVQQQRCEQSCNAKRTVLWDENVSGSANAGLCGQSASPHIQAMQRQAQAFATNQANAQRTCDQMAGRNNDEEPQVQAQTTPPATTPGDTTLNTTTTTTESSDTENSQTELASSGPSAGDIISGIGSLAGSLNTGGGGSFEPNFPDPPSFKVSKTQGNNSGFESGGTDTSGASLSSNKGLDLGARASAGGDDMRGLPDINDTRANKSGFTGQGPGSAKNNKNQGGQNNQAVLGGRNGGQAAMLSSSDGSAPGSGGRKGVYKNSVKGRNLIGGYKNIKPTDGGGALSIRPSDMKKYGLTNMKAKLNAARQTFGLKVPLMFKNGKFVRDFLAMKEGKGFKSRQAAMESYWKGNNVEGGTGEHACVSLNQCHTNEKASIFKLMNFRLQKSFYKVNIDI